MFLPFDLDLHTCGCHPKATTTVRAAAEEASAGSENDVGIGGENNVGRCAEDAAGHLVKDEYDPVACAEAAPLPSSAVLDVSISCSSLHPFLTHSHQPGAITTISSTINTVVSSDVSEQDEDKNTVSKSDLASFSKRVMLPGLNLFEVSARMFSPSYLD